MPDIIENLWEEPEQGDKYGIGGDPSEGLAHGDPAALEVISCRTGRQVYECYGAIPPFELAERAMVLGNYYNEALIAIENNKDGGCNAALHKMGYRNIYLQRTDNAKAYEKFTEKLGFNVNFRSRFKLITQARRYLEDSSISIRSRALLGEWVSFALDNGKFQGIRGAHDDKVMAFCIAVEAWRVQLLSLDLEENMLAPIFEGQEVGEELDDWDIQESESYEDKLINRVREKQEEQGALPAGQEQVFYPSTMENLL